METNELAVFSGHDVATPGMGRPREDVVEIALLLPAKQAEALVALSRRRQQSVGQILRGLIQRALSQTE